MNTLLLVFAISISVANCATIDQIATDVFNSLDEDKDNRLVPSEFLHYLKNYDPNGDSSISKAEFLQIANGTAPAEALRVFDTYDKNHDHVLDPKDADLVFKNFDENGDGHVTLKEFKEKYAETLLPPAIGK